MRLFEVENDQVGGTADAGDQGDDSPRESEEDRSIVGDVEVAVCKLFCC